jgi:BirA family biotin operon repressor/biotin-[acetyl-CoA-carboxylase] ligase
MQNGELKGLVLGLGVNLNANQNDINEIPDKIATALNIETGKTVTPDEFCENLSKIFFQNYDKFLDKGFLLIKDDYINKNCFLGKEINVKVFDRTENGLAKGVTDNGELVLKTNNNENLVLTIGDIL